MLFQVNLILEKIDEPQTPCARDGKATQIQEGLTQVEPEAKLSFGAAKASRLFLCSSPKAGKMRYKFSVFLQGMQTSNLRCYYSNINIELVKFISPSRYICNCDQNEMKEK